MAMFRQYEEQFDSAREDDGPSIELDLPPDLPTVPAHPRSSEALSIPAPVLAPVHTTGTREKLPQRPPEERSVLPGEAAFVLQVALAVPRPVWKRLVFYVALALAVQALFFPRLLPASVVTLLAATGAIGLAGVGVHIWVEAHYRTLALRALPEEAARGAKQAYESSQGFALAMAISKTIFIGFLVLWSIGALVFDGFSTSRTGIELLALSGSGVVGVLRLVVRSYNFL